MLGQDVAQRVASRRIARLFKLFVVPKLELFSLNVFVLSKCD
jgi:hypothetical protein